MPSWHIMTSTDFNNSADYLKTDDKLIFLSDTREIYRGNVPYTQSIILYDTLPSSPIKNKLYINKSNLESRVWDGSAWKVLSTPVATTVSSTNTTMGVSGKAVVDYVANALNGVDLSSLVPSTRKINNKALSSDITLNASDVGAAASSHTHTKSQITDFPTSMPASDVSSWAKASSKPTYTASEVNALPLSGGTLTGAVIMGKAKISWNSSTSSLDIEVTS